ncbi:MAG: TetR family transcriptional regulator [Acidimicrobiales bacterium]
MDTSTEDPARRNGRRFGPSEHKVACDPVTHSKSQLTREEIVSAGAVSFAERGFSFSMVEQIAAHVGATESDFYVLFPSKAALAAEVVRVYADRLEQLNRATLSRCADRLDAVVAMSFAAARLTRTDPVIEAGTRLLMERDTVDANLPLPFAGWVDRITGILIDGQGSGNVVAGVDARASAETIVSAFFGLQCVSHGLGDTRRLPRLLEEFWKMTLPTLRSDRQHRSFK